jgi:hypothetical protein
MHKMYVQNRMKYFLSWLSVLTNNVPTHSWHDNSGNTICRVQKQSKTSENNQVFDKSYNDRSTCINIHTVAEKI